MNQNLPLISIIIPVYNRPEIFAHSLKSALDQDYPNTEIIVVDDGSVPAITVPQHLLSRVRLFRQENNGAPAARNFGFSKSAGELVFFWDADVVAKKELLSTLQSALDKNLTKSYAYCDFTFGKKLMRAQPFSVEALRKNNYITTGALIRREDFPGFDESLIKFQDWDLWLTMLSKNKTGVYVPVCLFSIETGGTMSTWLPRCAYHAPWKYLPGIYSRVKKYEVAKKIIVTKHALN